jgi:hypothetical protein
LGQALENFNVVGEWRTRERENGVQIDSTGQLAGGGDVDGPEDLRRALAGEPDQFVQAVTEKLLTFALGRSLEYYDMPTVRAIVADAALEDYSFASIVLGITQSVPFQMRSVPAASVATGD